MKMDILNELESIRLCTAYQIGKEKTDRFPAGLETLENAHPVYHHLKGWQTPLEGCEQFEDLPGPAQDYIKYIEDYIECPVSLISIGPDRNQTILRM